MNRFEDVDRIEISMKDMIKLLKWRDKNKNLVNQYKQMIPKGVIVVKGGYNIKFKFIGEKYTIFEAYDENRVILKLKTERLGSHYRIIEYSVDDPTIKALKQLDNTYSEMDIITDTVTTVATMMAYMEHVESKK